MFSIISPRTTHSHDTSSSVSVLRPGHRAAESGPVNLSTTLPVLTVTVITENIEGKIHSLSGGVLIAPGTVLTSREFLRDDEVKRMFIGFECAERRISSIRKQISEHTSGFYQHVQRARLQSVSPNGDGQLALLTFELMCSGCLERVVPRPSVPFGSTAYLGLREGGEAQRVPAGKELERGAEWQIRSGATFVRRVDVEMSGCGIWKYVVEDMNDTQDENLSGAGVWNSKGDLVGVHIGASYAGVRGVYYFDCTDFRGWVQDYILPYLARRYGPEIADLWTSFMCSSRRD
ncbi:hypothetical protein BJ508DRAFT_311680 [Ascobolus immersus RN42]|uniref:Peptidase S1 domain-containing protein n=1 Tax=Ascobolus immersus RN42 TaxID=1160509 RepID=A0A3N4HPL9_ASCIM|nr:hypothetical protein BJ508DRAFT_311680 [Ascobolus immersus RN42]